MTAEKKLAGVSERFYTVIDDRLRSPAWILAGYAIIVALLTWPLARLVLTGNSELIYASTSHPDTNGTLWFHWWLDFALSSGLDPLHTEYLSYPLGEDLSVTCGNFLVLAVLYPVMKLLGLVWGYNTAVWLILVLNCGAGFLLLNEIFRNRGLAFAGGTLVSINNFTLVEMWQGRLEQLLILWLVLCLWALLKIGNTPKRRYAVAFAVFYVLTALSLWHYGIMVAIVLCFWMTVRALRAEWRAIRLALAGLGIGVIFLIPAAVLQVAALRSAYQWSLTGRAPTEARSELLETMTLGSLRARDLLLPADHEHISVAVVLAVVLACCFLSRTVRREGGYWIGLCILAIVMALGPEWCLSERGNGTPLPFYFLAKYVPVMVRFIWPARFLVFFYVSSLIIGLLALRAAWHAVGIRFRAGLVLLVIAILWAEFLVFCPQFAAMSPGPLSVPPVYRELAKLPPGAVIELPMKSSRLFWQTVHEKRSFVTSVADPMTLVPHERLQLLRDLGLTMRSVTIPGTNALARLRGWGFRYVVIHRDFFLAEIAESRESWNRAEEHLDELLGRPVVLGPDTNRLLYTIPKD